MKRVLHTIKSVGPNAWLAVAAMLLLALLLAQGASALALDRSGDGPADTLRVPNSPARDEAPSLEDYAAIASEGHFGKKKQPKPQLLGIFGDEALVGGSPKDAKWQGIGAKLPGGYELTEISPNAIVITKDDETKTLHVWPQEEGGPPSPVPPGAQGGTAPGSAPASQPTPTDREASP